VVMTAPAGDIRSNKRIMVYTASAMCGAAAFDGVIDAVLPGDPAYSLLPVVAVLVLVLALVTFGAGLPRWTLGLLGPLGVGLIAYSSATTPGVGDGAVLYALPVVWTSFFFGRRGAIAIVGSVGVGHGLALLALPAASAYAGRWVDVMVGTGAVALVVVVLETRNRAFRDDAHEKARVAADARDQAVEALNAKSMFVAKVSHELRTPLNGVLGTTELLRSTELDSQQLEYVDIARSAAEGLLLVINDILDYSKMEAGKVELELRDFSLRELVGEACAMLLVVSRSKGIDLSVEIAPALPAFVRGDQTRVRQVLVNLVSNAVKFTDSGCVTVRVRATSLDDGTRVRVEVSDTGIGIDTDALGRLFEPFTQADNTTSRRYGGTGLGLTISAQHVELMGGTIGADSTPGAGSTFWFEVELGAADGVAPEHPIADALRDAISAQIHDGPRPLVLVAEDNPVNQVLVVRMLERLGYQADLVSDGHEAVSAVERTQYAVVLMDCEMPGMDGYEATREIRRREENAARLPIIAMTAHSMSGDREKCIAAGMDDYISKPMRAAVLAETVARNLPGVAAEVAADAGAPHAA
jgi:signal transduction histidine kinase/CheY-like chemotaxis protein